MQFITATEHQNLMYRERKYALKRASASPTKLLFFSPLVGPNIWPHTDRLKSCPQISARSIVWLTSVRNSWHLCSFNKAVPTASIIINFHCTGKKRTVKVLILSFYNIIRVFKKKWQEWLNQLRVPPFQCIQEAWSIV